MTTEQTLSAHIPDLFMNCEIMKKIENLELNVPTMRDERKGYIQALKLTQRREHVTKMKINASLQIPTQKDFQQSPIVG